MKKPKAIVIDYGMGNLRSVAKALETVGFEVLITNDYKKLEEGDAIILPGVGAFGDAIKNLQNLNIIETLKEALEIRKKPFLGICLGLQLLFEKSYEFGIHKGLGILKGEVKFFGNRVKKVPHMGWNEIHPQKKHKILEGLKDGDFFYFVHSYYVEPEDKEVILTTTDYDGFYFTSAIAKENIIAVQFHPEKSQKKGLLLLKNFRKFVEEY
jgi:glutamine amidotransferase